MGAETVNSILHDLATRGDRITSLVASLWTNLTLILWLASEREWYKYTGERALKGLMKQLGPEDPITLSAMFNLGRTYLHLGQPKESQELLRTVVNRRRRLFGPNHLDTLMARNELGMSYCAQKRYAVAEILVRNVFETRKKR